jgi:hypothetical protein
VCGGPVGRPGQRQQQQQQQQQQQLVNSHGSSEQSAQRRRLRVLEPQPTRESSTLKRSSPATLPVPAGEPEGVVISGGLNRGQLAHTLLDRCHGLVFVGLEIQSKVCTRCTGVVSGRQHRTANALVVTTAAFTGVVCRS